MKRYGETWQALRLGDSCLLARGGDGLHMSVAASPNNAFDHWLSTEAPKRRDAGVLDIKELLAEFRPQLLQGRKSRNSPGGYSILEAKPWQWSLPSISIWARPVKFCSAPMAITGPSITTTFIPMRH